MKVQFSLEAKQDLTNIQSYITNNLSNPIAAKNVILRITKRIRLLSEAPFIGAPLSSIIDIKTNYRYLLCGNYTAFYRVDTDCVYIIRILYGRRNFARILFGVPEEDLSE